MSLRTKLSDIWCRFQGQLFPAPDGEVGTLPDPFLRRADQRAPREGSGARHMCVREHAEVYRHLMFGRPALTADRLMRPAVPP